jgi:hypothetical protein
LQITVMPKWRLMCSSAIHHHLGVARIERAIGSSARMISGSCTRARAMATPLLLAARQRVSSRWPAGRHVETLQRREAHRRFFASVQFQQRPGGRHMEGAAHHHVGSTSRRPARLNCWKIMAQRARHCRSARPRKSRDVGIAEADLPGRGIAQPVDHAQQRRLAGADWPITPRAGPLRRTRATPGRRRLPPKLLTTPSTAASSPRRFACLGSTGRLLRKLLFGYRIKTRCGDCGGP